MKGAFLLCSCPETASDPSYDRVNSTPVLSMELSPVPYTWLRNDFALQPLSATILIVKVPVIKMKRQQLSSESTKMGIQLTARAHQQYHH